VPILLGARFYLGGCLEILSGFTSKHQVALRRGWVLQSRLLWLKDLSSRLYKPRVVIACVSVEKALSYIKSIGIRDFEIIRCSRLSENIAEKYVKADYASQQGLIIIVDEPLNEKTRSLIRALNPYMPIVIVHPSPKRCPMLKISGSELECYRALF